MVGPGSADYVEALEEGVVALMIEKQSAVEQLEDILSIGGVDMVQFGPADYSMSLVIPGQWDDPRVQEAEMRTIETALAMGVQPRVELGDSSGAEPYLDNCFDQSIINWGSVKHFCIGWDVSIIHDWCKEHGTALARLLGR